MRLYYYFRLKDSILVSRVSTGLLFLCRVGRGHSLTRVCPQFQSDPNFSPQNCERSDCSLPHPCHLSLSAYTSQLKWRAPCSEQSSCSTMMDQLYLYINFLPYATFYFPITGHSTLLSTLIRHLSMSVLFFLSGVLSKPPTGLHSAPVWQIRVPPAVSLSLFYSPISSHRVWLPLYLLIV